MTEDKRYHAIANEIEQFLSLCKNGGYAFTSDDIDRQLNIKTREGKRYRWQILEGKVQKGELERSGLKKYRMVNNDLVEINWQNADVTDVANIIYPLDLQNYIKTYRKSVVILAGTPGAAKSAFMMHMMLLNMNGEMPQVMFSNDLTDVEIAERMIASGFEIPNPPPFKIFDRFNNFGDVVKQFPDCLVYIDYLDFNSDVFLIGEEIDKIYNAVNRGVVIVGIQKKFGQSIGLGGVFSMKRAKFYLTLDAIREGNNYIHKLTIEKARGRTDQFVNPKGMEFKFKVKNGVLISPVNKTAWNETPIKEPSQSEF